MDELWFVYLTAATIAVYFLAHLLTRRFDPFAPVWLFLVGYGHLYVVQAISFHDWAVGVRGKDLVGAANLQAFWALVWFLLVYQTGAGGLLARSLPRPPAGWPPAVVAILSPLLVAWGVVCAGILAGEGWNLDPTTMSSEEMLFRSFPFVMMVAAVMMIVTGLTNGARRRLYLAGGLATAAAYVGIWMFNGKRSHSLIAVLATVCAVYVTRQKRPSWPVLWATMFAGVLVVTIAIGWRNSRDQYERSAVGFINFVGDFQVSKVLESLDVDVGEAEGEYWTHETTEYGGFLLMVDTVPGKSGYDYGANYLRVFSTFIPRLVWPSKPLFGRTAWISAWVAGSEMERADDFASPAIGLLGATQLNGGAVGTLVVLGVIAVILRTAYEYFCRYQDVTWVQFFWAITFYNAWFMVVTDDPAVWFYYNWGITSFPFVVLMWWCSKFRTEPVAAAGRTVAAY
jgi:hypothetical protein